MQPMDPFAAPSATAFGNVIGGVQVYPDGYYEPVQSFDLLRMLTAPFKSPNWIMNLLWMFVCHLASSIVVGNLVAFGYLAEVAESRSGGRSEHWPDFDLDRLTEYLTRGLWPFLWSLIWTIPLLIFVGIPAGITVAISTVLSNNGNEVPSIIVGITGGLVSTAVFVVAMLGMMASVLHSGLGNEFQKGADFKWIWSYISKMGTTTVLVGIVFVVVSTLVTIAGFLACCVGLIAVGPILNMMSADLVAQLHDIFVLRGGESAFGGRKIDSDVIDAQVII